MRHAPDASFGRAMVDGKSSLGAIHEQILALLNAHPQGLNVFEIRQQLPEDIGVQQHLDKRIRELRYHYSIPRRKAAGKWVYIYEGPLDKPATDAGVINKTLRAKVYHKAHGRCQMCGRTVEGDGVKLEIDHKIPRTWGGATVEDNLWALCQLCNGGKRDYFASFDDELMREIMSKRSVYERIAETLRLHLGSPTPSWLLEFVANAEDFQEELAKALAGIALSGDRPRHQSHSEEKSNW
jgi:5-methylcytosine-specific restriction endonuclease McrA